MNILAVDCCTKLTGVALRTDENFCSEQKDLGRLQSRELPLMTERLLHENNLSWKNLDYIALTNGPGYFTGIRVGASYATGLAYASGAKIIPVSSLELLSKSYKSSKKILTMIYAGHGFVYAECEKFLEAGEYSHEFIKSWLDKTNKNSDVEIISDNPERIELSNEKILQVNPNLFALIETALQNINRAVNPVELKILYYRAPQGMN